MEVVRTVLAVWLCVVLSGCGDTRPSDAHEDPTVDETSSPVPPRTPQPVRSAVVEQSVADLASTLGLDAGEVEVVEVEDVTWRNGSRGCAQPGMAYTMAVVDGSRITLRVGGWTYEYHSGGSRPPSLCAKPTE